MGRIYLRNELPRDPRVRRISTELGITIPHVIGCCAVLWCYADEHSRDGVIPFMDAAAVDELVNRPGFAEALAAVDWLDVRPEGVVIPRYKEHCGQAEKVRRQDRLRQARRRQRQRQPVIAAILDRDASRCGICAQGLRADRAQIDHIVPLAWPELGNFLPENGSADRLENLQLAHPSCNKTKHALPFRHPELPGVSASWVNEALAVSHGSASVTHGHGSVTHEKIRAPSASASSSASASATNGNDNNNSATDPPGVAPPEQLVEPPPPERRPGNGFDSKAIVQYLKGHPFFSLVLDLDLLVHQCHEAFPFIDLLAEAKKASAWLTANETPKGPARFLHGWYAGAAVKEFAHEQASDRLRARSKPARVALDDDAAWDAEAERVERIRAGRATA